MSRSKREDCVSIARTRPPERDGVVRLPLSSGPPEKQVRDSLYELIDYKPYSLAAEMLRFTKALGEE